MLIASSKPAAQSTSACAGDARDPGECEGKARERPEEWEQVVSATDCHWFCLCLWVFCGLLHAFRLPFWVELVQLATVVVRNAL